MVERNIYENNANRFINKEMTYPDNTILKRNVDAANHMISIFYIGEQVTPQMLAIAKTKLTDYHLGNSNIMVKQGLKETALPDMSTLKSQIIQELFIKNEDLVAEQKNKIAELENELQIYSSPQLSTSILKEAQAFNPDITEASVTKSFILRKSNGIDTVFLTYFKFKRLPDWSQRNRLEKWLKVRLNANKIKLFIDK
jgi:hypothetical protein